MAKNSRAQGGRSSPGTIIKTIFILSVWLAGVIVNAFAQDRPLRQVKTPIPQRFAFSIFSRPPLAIPGMDKPLTQHYIALYSSRSGLAWLKTVLGRSGPYLGFIRRELAERNMPWELAYLPVIESGYLVNAKSRSGAAGLWQFMTNSIAPFHIRVNDWVDERLDFWKSTTAALIKLKENYEIFDDWDMALAAYNTGLGGLTRIVKTSGIKDYWTLSEKKLLTYETIQYVPRFLAVVRIASCPREYGLEASWPEDPQWIKLKTDRQIDITMLAEKAGVDKTLLKEGNRELRYGITPATGSYEIKTPAKDARAVAATLDQKNLKLIKYFFHKISYGDSLSVLAQHYRVSVQAILAANPGTRPLSLRLGARLCIPVMPGVKPMKERTVKDILDSLQGSGPSAASGPDFTGTHLVQQGETLWSIALMYKVDPLILAEANGMNLGDVLSIGRSLKVPINN